MALTIGTNNQSIVSGLKRASDLQSYQKVPQYVDKYLELWKGIAPLTVISERAGKLKEVKDDNFFHMEEDELPQLVTVSGAHNSAVTTINLASGNGSYIRVGDILHAPTTGEQMLVTAFQSADVITVTRAHGGTSAATIPTDGTLQIMPMSDTDGNTAPSGLASTPARKINYLQIEKESVELSGRDMNTEIYGPDERTKERSLAMRRLLWKVEKALLFGGLDAGTTAGHRKATGGLKYWISSNTTDASGGFTETVWNLWLEKIFRFNYDTGSLLVFAGENVCAALDQFGRDRVRYVADDKVFGVAVKRYQSNFGDVNVIRHGMFNSAFDPTGTWAGYAFAVNTDNFKMAHFAGRNMQFFKDKQTPDLDGIKDYWLHDFGAWVGKERTHGLLYGVPDPLS